MANRIVTQGLLSIGQNFSRSTNYNTARYCRSMSVDDSSNALAAGDTAANSGGAVTNFFVSDFDATPTEAAPAVITHIMTLSVAEAVYTIRRILLHNNAAASVTSSSTTLVGGTDGQALAHTADFTLEIRQKITYTNV